MRSAIHILTVALSLGGCAVERGPLEHRRCGPCPEGRVCEDGYCVERQERDVGEDGMMPDVVADSPGCTVSGNEVCDGEDNDCNGVIDDVATLGSGCIGGEGACRGEGSLVCGVEGLVCDVVPGDPSEEVCNGIDDDCDGERDEFDGEPPSCRRVTNAVARCDQGECRYTCIEGRSDRNGDLESLESDGCECDASGALCCDPEESWSGGWDAGDETFADLVITSDGAAALLAWTSSSGIAYVLVDAGFRAAWPVVRVDTDGRPSQLRAAASGGQFVVTWWDPGRQQMSLRSFGEDSGEVETVELHGEDSGEDPPVDVAVTFVEGAVVAAWVPARCSGDDCVHVAVDSNRAPLVLSNTKGSLTVRASGLGRRVLVLTYTTERGEPIGVLNGVVLHTDPLDEDYNLQIDRVIGTDPSIVVVSSSEFWVVGVSDGATPGGVELALVSRQGELVEQRTQDSQRGRLALAWMEAPAPYLAYLHHRDRAPKALRYRHLRGDDLVENSTLELTESEALDSFGIAALGELLLVGTIPANGSRVRLTVIDGAGVRACP